MGRFYASYGVFSAVAIQDWLVLRCPTPFAGCRVRILGDQGFCFAQQRPGGGARFGRSRHGRCG
eukprot:162357-Lingulodinium_polyedra.AAC.1